MKASKVLKKQIIIEIFALLLFCLSILYAIYALNKANGNKVYNYDGVVTVLDDSKFNDLSISSDGVGLNTNGVTYAVTNNKKETLKYDLIVIPSISDEDILKHIKVSLDDVSVRNLSSLEKLDEGYVLGNMELGTGYTKIHSIKFWYDLDSDKTITKNKVDFEYKIRID